MKESLTQREYLDWQLYWKKEPWGPLRENLHAALIAREVRRPQLKKGSKVTLDDFMVMDPEERARENRNRFINMMMALSKREDS